MCLRPKSCRWVTWEDTEFRSPAVEVDRSVVLYVGLVPDPVEEEAMLMMMA